METRICTLDHLINENDECLLGFTLKDKSYSVQNVIVFTITTSSDIPIWALGIFDFGKFNLIQIIMTSYDTTAPCNYNIWLMMNQFDMKSLMAEWNKEISIFLRLWEDM